MNGLWTDSWFYISAAGFLISSVLFIFLLRQYRIAVEAEEAAEPGPEPQVRPILAAKPAEALAPVSVPIGAKTSPEGSKDSAPTGAASLEKLEKEISALKALVIKQAESSQDILKRLADMSARLAAPPPAKDSAPAEAVAAPLQAETAQERELPSLQPELAPPDEVKPDRKGPVWPI